MFLRFFSISIFAFFSVESYQSPISLVQDIKGSEIISSTLQNNDIQNIHLVRKFIRKHKNDVQVRLYEYIFTYCLWNKKMDLALTFMNKIPTRLLTRNTPDSTHLGLVLLKQAVLTQSTVFIQELLVRIPFNYLKKYFSYKDTSGYTLLDYAHQTKNQEIIELMDLTKIKSLQNISAVPTFFRAIAGAFTLLIILPIVVYIGMVIISIGIAAPSAMAMGGGDIFVFGFPFLFPPTILISTLAFGNLTLRKFGFEDLIIRSIELF